MRIPPTLRRSIAGDDGIAMVLSLLFMLLLSALGTAMLVLSRSETLSSVNYRMMSQARFGAESAVHKAAHYLINSYTLPGSGSDPLSGYDATQSPVLYSGQPVVMSAFSDVTGNYPVSAAQAAFASEAQGSLQAGEVEVLYSASATLLSMRTVVPYASAGTQLVQTWRLTGRGLVEGARQAEVEVSAVIERHIVPTFTYGLFATYPYCDALYFSGGTTVDSYDSSSITLVNGLPRTTPSGANIGTNGSLTQGGGAGVRGSLSTPRSGVGNCRDGAVTALDLNGNAVIDDGLVKLAQRVAFQAPDVPSPLPPTTTTTINGSTPCSGVPISSGACTITYPTMGVGSVTLDPQGTNMALDNVNVTAGATLTLKAGTYFINSLKLTGNSKVVVASGPVILNFAGVDQGIPADFAGGAIINTTFIPGNFRVLYAGTGTLKLTGGTTTSAAVYAPNADAEISGGAHYFGAVVAETIKLTGGVKMHVDRQLREFFSVGPQMMSVFTWKEY